MSKKRTRQFQEQAFPIALRELLDSIDMLAQGDTFSKHVSLMLVLLALKDRELGLQDIRTNIRLYEWITKMAPFIPPGKGTEWASQVDKVSFP